MYTPMWAPTAALSAPHRWRLRSPHHDADALLQRCFALHDEAVLHVGNIAAGDLGQVVDDRCHRPYRAAVSSRQRVRAYRRRESART